MVKTYLNTIALSIIILITINAKTNIGCHSVFLTNKLTTACSTLPQVFNQEVINKSNNSIEKNKFSPENINCNSGLIFENEEQYRWENNSYTDVIQLIGLSNIAQALQFKISVNKALDDSVTLFFQSLEKGSDISDSSWVLDYNIFRGTTNQYGASADEIYVLLYNTNYNNGLPPSDYLDLIKVNYRVVDLPDVKDSVKSSMIIHSTLASTYQGDAIDITPSRDEFKIYALVPVVYPERGLIFQKDTVYQLEYNKYTEIMQLKGLDKKLQALQFKLFFNQAVDDSVILTFQDIQKGADINDPSWYLDYNVIQDSIAPNGGAIDEVRVLLYNQNQNNGLLPGDYDELFKVKYRIADLPRLQDRVKSSIHISEALGSTYQGNSININPSREDLIIYAQNRGILYGDVNDDGCVDIQDLMLIVDHILGRRLLNEEEFERADIAPWTPGNPVPEPDGVINVLDLALLQEIILNGVYPSGLPLIDCDYLTANKYNGNSLSKIKFFIREDGISVYLNSDKEIIGVQFEFDNVNNDPQNMQIQTILGAGYFKQTNSVLKVLLYDRQGKKVFQSGENLLADMPFNISHPEDITIKKIILIDSNREKIVETQFEIVYDSPHSLPFDYNLYQNYPNPFNPKTIIRYSIPDKNLVVLKIYDLLGIEVETLVNEEKLPGKYELNWTAQNLTSGVYFYRIQAGDFVQTKKMIFLK